MTPPPTEADARRPGRCENLKSGWHAAGRARDFLAPRVTGRGSRTPSGAWRAAHDVQGTGAAR
jgi:hypothetical protein